MDSLDEDELEEAEPRARGRGRGRGPGGRRAGAGRPRKVTTTTREEIVEDGSADGLAKVPTDSPLFGDEDDGKNIDDAVKIRVERLEPPEGILGYLDNPGSASEKDIAEKWGGSMYRLQALNGLGRIIKGRQIRIAGDPIFMTRQAQLRYERETQRLGGGLSVQGQTVPVQPTMSTQDIFAFMREQETQRRAAEREHQERMAQIERESDDRRRRFEAEREEQRRRDDRERDEQRRREEVEREERHRRNTQEAEARSAQLTAQLLTMAQAGNKQTLDILTTQLAASQQRPSEGGGLLESLKTIAVIKDSGLFDGPGGGDEPDGPMGMLAKHGAEWLGALGNAIRPNPGAQVGAAQPQQQVAAAPQGLQLPPALAPKVTSLVTKIASMGKNPEEEIGKLLDHVNGQLEGAQPAPAAPPEQPKNPYALPDGDVVPMTRNLKPSTVAQQTAATGNPQPINNGVAKPAAPVTAAVIEDGVAMMGWE